MFKNYLNERRAAEQSKQIVQALDDPEKRSFSSKSRIFVSFPRNDDTHEEGETETDGEMALKND